MKRALFVAALIAVLTASGAVAKPTPPPVAPIRLNPMPGQFSVIAAPSGFLTTTSATTCTQHAGALGALVCGAVSKSGWINLVWNWSPCGSSNCVKTISGYHVYRAGSKGVKPALVGTVTNQAQTVLVTASYAIGECFMVRAFSGNLESHDSNRYCVGGSPTTAPVIKHVPPTPTPFPKPIGYIPQTHVITLTGDQFPGNLNVRVGDTVRWVNQDTDEHNVTGEGANWNGFNQDVPPVANCRATGQTTGCYAQFTFKSAGTYVYHCVYHDGMRGTISVFTKQPILYRKHPPRK